ncbi:alpha/beta hydrolase family protein [Actinomadura craniellae]|uniref:alpha/beta hydrolase family protein n=1 Tax=Actinomadura craniellae TaxID=2231787 RepID=UPI001F2106E8|nr:alpha/beta hydrolase [Actinomadura craniellae]
MKRALHLIPAAAALVAAMAAAPTTAQAAASPYERGPDPTEQTITAERGPFQVATATVPANSASGFNRGTIYYPTDTSQGTFGAVAIIPGFIEPESTMSWYGPRLASQGFVVFTLEPFSVLNFPDDRANQLLAALDYLTGSSSVRSRVDASRLAVMGHSMGGGGTLRAAEMRPSLQAAIPLAPWHLHGDWRNVRVPTMIQAADNDFIAGVGNHAQPFYQNLTNAPEKAYLLFENYGHMSWISANTPIAKYSIAWLKRYVDDDTRYSKFLCPAPGAPSSTFQEYRHTCPD